MNAVANLNIAHTVAAIDNEAAGPSHSVPGLAAAQARLGCRVEIYSIGQMDIDERQGFVDRRFASQFSKLPLLKRLFFSSEMHTSLMMAKPQVIHNHGLWLMPNVYGAEVARRVGAKYVFAPRGMLSSAALDFSSFPKKIFGLMYQNRALAQVDLFHATSEQEYQEIRAYGQKQAVAIIPNGINLPILAADLRPPEMKKVVVSLGRIHPKKALDRLLYAWSKIEHDYPDWKLLIVGPSEVGYAKELQQLIGRLSLKNAEIRGPVFGNEKSDLLATSELFVLSTLNENFGMAVAESLAAGTPVISTKGAPWSGLVTNDCGWWIDHGVEPLTATLRTALALSPEKRAEMGRKGRQWMANEFSWDAIALQMMEAYRWTLEGGERPAWVMPHA